MFKFLSFRSTRDCRGYSLPEVLLTLLMLGLLVGSGFMIWRSTRERVEITSAARLLRLMVHQARMQSIFTGVSHFVAIDTDSNQIEIFTDDGATPGVLDTGDRQISAVQLSSAVRLAMPSDPATLTSPFGSGSLTDAWPLPSPSGGAWAGRKGVRVTSTGLIETVEATPELVDGAVIVFSDGNERAAAVGIRGRMGQVRAFEYFNEEWRER